MSWGEKIPNTNELLVFLEDWKTRKDIQEKYNLTPIESWSCVKYLKGLSFDVENKQNVGLTKRADVFRTRRFSLIEVRNEERKKLENEEV